MRACGIDLPEPGQAAFLIGGEAEGVGGEIAGRDGEPVFGDDFCYRQCRRKKKMTIRLVSISDHPTWNHK